VSQSAGVGHHAPDVLQVVRRIAIHVGLEQALETLLPLRVHGNRAFDGASVQRDWWIASQTAGKIWRFRLTTPGAWNKVSSTRSKGSWATVFSAPTARIML